MTSAVCEPDATCNHGNQVFTCLDAQQRTQQVDSHSDTMHLLHDTLRSIPVAVASTFVACKPMLCTAFTCSCALCRIRKVAQGSAVFEVRPEEEYTGKVMARAVPPNRGYNSAGESGLVAFEEAGMKQQLPYGAADLQVTFVSVPRLLHVCITQQSRSASYLVALTLTHIVTVLTGCSPLL